MKIVYIADDGKEFNDEWECRDYEWLLSHPAINDICMYDKDGNKMDDVMSEDTYNTVMKIIVPTKEAVAVVQELGEGGFCAYEYVNDVGTWIWKEGNWMDGKFVKVG